MNSPVELSAHGKLLITGEYLVLAGARALALPLKFGQDMTIKPSDDGIIHWQSIDPSGTWFTAEFTMASPSDSSSCVPRPASRVPSLSRIPRLSRVPRHSSLVPRPSSLVPGPWSLVPRHASRVTRHVSRVTCHSSLVPGPSSLVPRHSSRVTRHVSRVTCHSSLVPRHFSHLPTAETLLNLLTAARTLSPQFLQSPRGCHVTVTANYPLAWGLGSSSTLCSLVARWAGIDAFALYRLVSNGSGYDLACATQTGMIFYKLSGEPGQQNPQWPETLQPGQNPLHQNPSLVTCHASRVTRHVSRVTRHSSLVTRPSSLPATPGPALRNATWFAYLGNKQETAREVSAFLDSNNYTAAHVARVSELARLICEAKTAGELIALVEEHEAMISAILNRPVLARRFPAFPGAVKSLGAWGGDFAMFVSDSEPAEVEKILRSYGLSEIFRFDEIAVGASDT